MNEVTARVENGRLIIEVPIQLEQSSTGKSMLLFASRGVKNTTETANGNLPQLRGTIYEGGCVAINMTAFVTPPRNRR